MVSNCKLSSYAIEYHKNMNEEARIIKLFCFWAFIEERSCMNFNNANFRQHSLCEWLNLISHILVKWKYFSFSKIFFGVTTRVSSDIDSGELEISYTANFCLKYSYKILTIEEYQTRFTFSLWQVWIIWQLLKLFSVTIRWNLNHDTHALKMWYNCLQSFTKY